MSEAPYRRTHRAAFASLVCLLGLLLTFLSGVTFLPRWLFLSSFLLTGGLLAALAASFTWPSAFRSFLDIAAPLPCWSGVSVLALCFVLVADPDGVSVAVWASAGLLSLGTGYLTAFLTALGFGTEVLFTQIRLPVWYLLPLLGFGVPVYQIAQWSRSPFVDVVFFVGVVLLTVFVCVLIPLAVYQKFVDRPAISPSRRPTVSVLIPAYNEEDVVEDCIESALRSAYPLALLDVVVIDDGSTDETYARATQYVDAGVTVYPKRNGGKYSALNYGIFCTDGDVVITVDADSILEPETIPEIVGALWENPRTGAVCGNVKVANAENPFTRMQALEYALGINTFRRAFSALGTVPIVPGCLGAFRREALESVGGYDPQTITEDFDLSLKLLRDGWRIEQSEAVVRTQVPFRVHDLYKQRLRWYKGAFQTLIKHRGVFTETDAGILHWYVYPYRALSLLFVPVMSPTIVVVVALGLAFGPTWYVLGVAGYFAAVLALSSFLIVALEGEDPRLLVYVPLFIVGYKQFLDYVVAHSAFELARSADTDWSEIERMEHHR